MDRDAPPNEVVRRFSETSHPSASGPLTALVREAVASRSPEALSVLADWLVEHGDPWGEVLAHSLTETPDADGVMAGIRLLSAAWFGAPVVSDPWNDKRYRRQTWRRGECGIRVHWEGGRPVEIAADCWEGRSHTRLADFLHTPPGQLLDRLELVGESTEAVLERLCARGPLGGLQHLAIHNGPVDLLALAPRVPRLRTLTLQAVGPSPEALGPGLHAMVTHGPALRRIVLKTMDVGDLLTRWVPRGSPVLERLTLEDCRCPEADVAAWMARLSARPQHQEAIEEPVAG